GSFAVAGLRGMSRNPLALGRWRPAATLAAWSLVLVSLAPLLVLLVRAARGGGLQDVLHWLGQAPLNSLTSGAVAATVIAALGLVLGPSTARRTPGATARAALSVVAFSSPGPIPGVGSDASCVFR